MIKAIIFDCFGVLTTDTWLAFCESLPDSVDIELARELNRAYDRGIIDRDAFVEGVKDVTGQTPPEIEKMFGGEVMKNVKLIERIRELKKDYKIGLLSNISSDWITREFLSEDEVKLFDAMIFSHEVGMIKPDPRIYMLTCERLRVGPHEALMIDDRAGYVEAAKAEGLQGIVYQDMATLNAELENLLNTDD